ncbi:MAG TPA: DUF4142 domain-containing protein [Gemmatimonadaceae bacterium]|nr:DUF4142 domain-containing protein [Gemmatimonadaceae bacterium]
MRTPTAVALMVLSIAACSKKDTAIVDSASVGASAAAATPAPLPTPPAPLLTESNIVAKVASADSSEIALAKLAETKANKADVKSYARMLVADHTANAKEFAELEKKANMTAQMPANDMSAQDAQAALERFKSMDKAVFDTAFVNHAVEAHQKMLTEVQNLAATATTPELKDLLTKTGPVVQKHIDKGQELQKKLTGM